MEDGIYKIQSIGYTPEGKGKVFKFIGRVIIANNVLEHLEDRFGVLDRLMPEGPLKTQEAVLRRLERSPYWDIERQVPEVQQDALQHGTETNVKV